jgi:uncharacterized protein YndB with AHSA1/START domain
MATERLELSVRIAARPATVFRFLSDPDRFRAWMGEGATLGADRTVRLQYPTGEVAEGDVLELVPDRRLVFSYGYRGNQAMGPGSTTVRIDLQPDGEGTRVVLVQENLPDATARRGHEGGWTHYLSRLRGVAVAESLAGVVESAIDSYIAAWAATDAGRRLELLQGCWAEDGLFADAMGSAEGRIGLSNYIGAAQQFMPGARLDRVGGATLVLDRARFAWRASDADGRSLGHGTSFAEFDPGGRITRLSGFWEPGGSG